MSKRRTGHSGSPPEHIADILRARIREGELAPGDSLPPQQVLAEEFGTSRGAVSRAQEALKAEGLLTPSGRGAPPAVADHTLVPETPRKAGVELAEQLMHAFQSEHVTIDAFSLTTETLNLALAGPRLAIDAGELAPRSIRIRVLMPSPSVPLALPKLVSDAADPRPLERLRDLMRTYSRTLQTDFAGLMVRRAVPEVSVEVRTVELTPVNKFYLLNGTDVLFGFYEVHRVPVDADAMEIYDVLGVDAPLFHHSSDPHAGDPQGGAFVQRATAWFDSLWHTIAAPLPPES